VRSPGSVGFRVDGESCGVLHAVSGLSFLPEAAAYRSVSFEAGSVGCGRVLCDGVAVVCRLESFSGALSCPEGFS
jgi:hypothetical protein